MQAQEASRTTVAQGVGGRGSETTRPILTKALTLAVYGATWCLDPSSRARVGPMFAVEAAELIASLDELRKASASRPPVKTASGEAPGSDFTQDDANVNPAPSNGGSAVEVDPAVTATATSSVGSPDLSRTSSKDAAKGASLGTQGPPAVERGVSGKPRWQEIFEFLSWALRTMHQARLRTIKGE